VVEASFTPRGPYLLRRMVPQGIWRAALPAADAAVAWQTGDGVVHVRAGTDAGIERARFMLAVDDDHAELHRRFRADPLLGPSLTAFRGLRPLRLATVAHSLLRAVCGQLVTWSRARELERAVLASCGSAVPEQADLAAFAPAELCRRGLSAQRAAALVRLCRTVDLERLRDHPTATVSARLTRERGLGAWSSGVVALHGLGRYDLGLVGDLGLIKLMSSLQGRWVDPEETAELLAPYGEWQGLAGVYLLSGFEQGLVPGANPDQARHLQARRRAA
jgi:DNA-3-methyladenine glycosylase II